MPNVSFGFDFTNEQPLPRAAQSRLQNQKIHLGRVRTRKGRTEHWVGPRMDGRSEKASVDDVIGARKIEKVDVMKSVKILSDQLIQPRNLISIPIFLYNSEVRMFLAAILARQIDYARAKRNRNRLT